MVSSDRRLADHFGGKLHLGYMQIREKLADIKVCQSSFILIAVDFTFPRSVDLLTLQYLYKETE